MTTIGWFDCGSGASGDMVLGALVDAGVELTVIAEAVAAVAPEQVSLHAERVTRHGIAATRVHVTGTESHHHRTWTDMVALLDAATLDEPVRTAAHDTFRRLAEAEARVHGTTAEQVHFHEVGALDAIADVVGACAGLAHLRLDTLHASAVAVGSGFTRAAHGRLPVPVPAVVELLSAARVPSYAGDDDVGHDPGPGERRGIGELCTPTGAALLTTHVTHWGDQPGMRIVAQGFGAGGREIPGRPNALRLLIGAATEGDGSVSTQLVVETNVDDLDPRLWPDVLQALLTAGAIDAWLTPILMKKGRPAHTLSALVDPARIEAVRRVIFQHTSAIGLREHAITKHALERQVRTVTVHGQSIRVKVARQDGIVVNVQPEYEDVAQAAQRTGRSRAELLAVAATLGWG